MKLSEQYNYIEGVIAATVATGHNIRIDITPQVAKLELENEVLGEIVADAQWCAAGHMDEWVEKEMDKRINALPTGGE